MKSLSLQAINESSPYEVSAVYDGCYQFTKNLVVIDLRSSLGRMLFARTGLK